MDCAHSPAKRTGWLVPSGEGCGCPGKVQKEEAIEECPGQGSNRYVPYGTKDVKQFLPILQPSVHEGLVFFGFQARALLFVALVAVG